MFVTVWIVEYIANFFFFLFLFLLFFKKSVGVKTGFDFRLHHKVTSHAFDLTVNILC